MLAHAGGVPEFASTAFIAGALVLGWTGYSRLRGRGFGRLPKPGAWALVGVCPLLLVASVVVPSALWPQTASGPRPTSTATIRFDQPASGQTVSGGVLEVLVRLEGGTIVEASTTDISPDRGHIHLFVDGAIVSMTYGEVQAVPLDEMAPGVHRLLAEFVAADHAPFDPRVVVTTTFVKEGT